MKKRLAGIFLLALALMFVCAGYAQADFVQSGANTMYMTASGTYLTGLQKINGSWYYFDASGILQKSGWIKTSDGRAFFATDNGTLLCNQWKDKLYYLKENGERASGLTRIGNALYYFSQKTGKVQKGKLKDEEGNLYITNKRGVIYSGRLFRYEKQRYYAYENGKLAKGMAQVGNDLYFFQKCSGKMVYNVLRKINGYLYYFQKNGKAARDKWVKVKGKFHYYLSDGRMATNMYIGKWYVDENGDRKKASAAPKAGINKINGKNYLYDSSGKLVTSQWVKTEDGTYYAGTDGVALTGLQTIGSLKYYFDEEGLLQTDTIAMVNGTAYVIAADGHITGTSDASGAAIVEFAKKYVGNPYVYGGTSLTKGADCSGFCFTVFKTFGIQLMRVADDQMKGPSAAYQKLGYKKGITISDKDLMPGDLVFYGSATYASHVAIYIGNNKVVHAANSRLGIIISDMDYVHSRVKNKNMRYWA